VRHNDTNGHQNNTQTQECVHACALCTHELLCYFIHLNGLNIINSPKKGLCAHVYTTPFLGAFVYVITGVIG